MPAICRTASEAHRKWAQAEYLCMGEFVSFGGVLYRQTWIHDAGYFETVKGLT